MCTALADTITTRSPLSASYEVDGLGGCKLMDDANVPSLLSLPYHAPGTYDEAIYANTRKWVLSPSNP